jgi:hypothetical protein
VFTNSKLQFVGVLFRRPQRRDNLSSIESRMKEQTPMSIAFWKAVDAVISVFEPIMKLLRMADSEEPCTGFVHQRMTELQAC